MENTVPFQLKFFVYSFPATNRYNYNLIWSFLVISNVSFDHLNFKRFFPFFRDQFTINSQFKFYYYTEEEHSIETCFPSLVNDIIYHASNSRKLASSPRKITSLPLDFSFVVDKPQSTWRITLPSNHDTLNLVVLPRLWLSVLKASPLSFQTDMISQRRSSPSSKI